MTSKEEEIDKLLSKEKNRKIKKLTQRADRTVYLIDNKYILKKENIDNIKAEKIFFETYKKAIYPKVIYYQEDKEFILYNYINNKEVELVVTSLRKYILQILKIIKEYQKTDLYGYGEAANPTNTWVEFLKKEIKLKQKDIPLQNRKYLKVKEAITILEKFNFQKKLIHGDLGLYNVLTDGAKIVGIIDPRTIIGDEIYDFIYFWLSQVNLANSITINDIFNSLKNQPKKKVISLMYIILYDRISIETKNNRINSVLEYEKLWKELENFEKKM